MLGPGVGVGGWCKPKGSKSIIGGKLPSGVGEVGQVPAPLSVNKCKLLAWAQAELNFWAQSETSKLSSDKDWCPQLPMSSG